MVDCCPMAATQRMSCAPLSPLAASSAGSLNNSPVRAASYPQILPRNPFLFLHGNLPVGLVPENHEATHVTARDAGELYSFIPWRIPRGARRRRDLGSRSSKVVARARLRADRYR